MKKRVTLLLLLVWTLAVVYAAVQPVIAAGKQPHMEAALKHLQMAKEELQKAEADKGGHRAKALEALDAAIAHTNEGIAFAASH